MSSSTLGRKGKKKRTVRSGRFDSCMPTPVQEGTEAGRPVRRSSATTAAAARWVSLSEHDSRRANALSGVGVGVVVLVIFCEGFFQVLGSRDRARAAASRRCACHVALCDYLIWP